MPPLPDGDPALSHDPEKTQIVHLRRFNRAHLWLAAIFSFATVLRFWCLDCYGLWYDEVASIEIARRGVGAILSDRFGGMLVQTPLHYLLVWLTLQPADSAATSVLVRLPSAVAGALTPLVVYALGRELFGRTQGLLAALLIALSAIHIGHSQDVRPYTFLVLFTALATYCLLRAERGGDNRWWAGFAIVLLLDIHTSYFALSLALPALAPYILWVILRGARGGAGRVAALKALISSLLVGFLSIPVALDLLAVHRSAPDWSLFTSIAGRQVALLPARLAQLGIAGTLEEWIQWVLFAVGLVGFASAIRSDRKRGAALCLLYLLVPALLLAAFRTTNIVFQRYALFAMPFYFLLLANGLTSLWRLPLRQGRARFFARYSAAGLASLLFILFGLSTLLYFSPAEHRRLSFLPDYRGAAHYLSGVAHEGDLIVLLDEPALGKAVVDLYWGGHPPADVIDARDPLLFSRKPGGSVFWVVSFFQNEPEFMEGLAGPQGGWLDSAQFERIAVLKEAGGALPTPGLERLISKMQAQLPTYQPVLALDGCIEQARGHVAEAVRLYRAAGSYYPRLGEEFLSTAQGYAARGSRDLAWREAVTSKFMQPDNPEVHRWLSANLRERGIIAQAEAENQIANELAARPFR